MQSFSVCRRKDSCSFLPPVAEEPIGSQRPPPTPAEKASVQSLLNKEHEAQAAAGLTPTRRPCGLRFCYDCTVEGGRSS
jgi:hypothetical protein